MDTGVVAILSLFAVAGGLLFVYGGLQRIVRALWAINAQLDQIQRQHLAQIEAAGIKPSPPAERPPRGVLHSMLGR